MSMDAHWALFEKNPHPTWAFDLGTLAFLRVNEAAVRRYGYSHEEFSRQTSKTSVTRRPCPPCTNALATYPGARGVGGLGAPQSTTRTSTWRSLSTGIVYEGHHPAMLVQVRQMTGPW